MRRSGRRAGATLAFLAAHAALAAGLQFDEIDTGTISCWSEPGICDVVDDRTETRYREVQIRVVEPPDSAFVTTLTHSSDVSVGIRWRPASWKKGASCRAATRCASGDRLSCALDEAAQCGQRSGVVWCGQHSEGEFLATVRACTYLDQYWADSPAESAPQEGALHESEPEVEALIEAIESAHSGSGETPFSASLDLTLEGSVRRVVEISHLGNGTAIRTDTSSPSGRTHSELVRFGSTAFVRIREGVPFVKLDITPRAGRAPRATPFLRGFDHSIYSPEATFERFAKRTDVWYLGTGPCEGSPEASCHLLTFEVDSRPHSLTARVDSLLLDSMTGSDANGPQRATYRYENVAVGAPAESEVLEIGEDPAETARALELLGGDGG